MFTATIQHHSISRARTISANTLSSAMRKATSEFGDEFLDYRIVIFADNGYLMAWRRVRDRRWTRT